LKNKKLKKGSKFSKKGNRLNIQRIKKMTKKCVNLKKELNKITSLNSLKWKQSINRK